MTLSLQKVIEKQNLQESNYLTQLLTGIKDKTK